MADEFAFLWLGCCFVCLDCFVTLLLVCYGFSVLVCVYLLISFGFRSLFGLLCIYSCLFALT